MNVVALVAAILFGTMQPVETQPLLGIKEQAALSVDGQVLVAVVPQPIAGYREKSELLQEVADAYALEWGDDVILSEDLMTYLALVRMEKRGTDDYERQTLASRIVKTKDSCFVGKANG